MASPLRHNPVVSSELCPRCGKFTDAEGLDDITGWCVECTPRPKNTTSSVSFALAANHAAVTHYVTQGQSVWMALESARADRPKCLVCGDVIKRAKRNAIFCRQHKECRRISRRYVYLYDEKGLTKVEALAVILNEITGGE